MKIKKKKEVFLPPIPYKNNEKLIYFFTKTAQRY